MPATSSTRRIWAAPAPTRSIRPVPFNLTNSATVLGTVERLLLQGGANVLNGLAGGDTLTGGTGNDTFRFNSALGSTNINTITD